MIDYSMISYDINDIADGYRNVCCKTIDGIFHIILFGYSKKTGQPQIFAIPHNPRVVYNVKYDTDLKDIYGNNCIIKHFNTAFERRKWLTEKGNINVVEALKPEEEFLHDKFDKVVLDSNFNTQPLRYHFIDIETEVSESFMHPVDALNRINMITVYDTYHKKYFTWSLGNVKNKFKDREKYVIFNFNDDEIKLLRSFIRWFSSNYPDVITGWNTYYFDIPYVFRRIENVLGQEYAERLSPMGYYRISEANTKNKRGPKSDQIFIRIAGISQLDLLLLYRDKFVVRASLDGGYNLSNVGEAEGLGRKVEYEGTIKDFYLKDFQRFYEYNVRDVELTVKIEEKCRLIPLARKIASGGLCLYESIYASVGYITGSLVSFAKTHYNVYFPSYINTPNIDQAYEGAYVFPTQVGFYNHGIGVVDFNSLYPNTMVSINLSPETYVGKFVVPYDPDADENYLKLHKTGQTKVIKKAQMEELLKTKFIVTKNDTVFIKHEVKWGIVAAWCKHFYDLRKSVKKQMLKLEAEANNETNEERKLELEDQAANLDVVQKGLKTQINSCYGLFGTIFSPFYNPNLAETITRQGQFCNRSAAAFLSEVFEKSEVKTGPISGDTDSLFINLENETLAFAKAENISDDMSMWSDEHKMKFWNKISDFVNGTLTPYVQKLLTDYCHTSQAHNVRYELEYMADTGIYEAKKRYAVHKIVEEGMLVDKFKYTGIELKKATVPVEIKEFLEEVYTGALTKKWTSHDYTKYIENCYEVFKTLPIESIAIWKGYNTEKDITGFLKLAKGAGIHVRAAQYYNMLIKKLGLSKKYDEILLGDKLRYVYLYPSNAYNIDCIAYKDQYPEEFRNLFKIDYETMFQKLVLQPLAGYEKAMRFQKADPVNQMEEDIFSL